MADGARKYVGVLLTPGGWLGRKRELASRDAAAAGQAAWSQSHHHTTHARRHWAQRLGVTRDSRAHPSPFVHIRRPPRPRPRPCCPRPLPLSALRSPLSALRSPLSALRPPPARPVQSNCLPAPDSSPEFTCSCEPSCHLACTHTQ